MKPKSIHPEGWSKALGYSNGMLMPDGTLHIAGQIGWDKDKTFVEGGFIAQMEQALTNIAEIVKAAGGDVDDVPARPGLELDRERVGQRLAYRQIDRIVDVSRNRS